MSSAAMRQRGTSWRDCTNSSGVRAMFTERAALTRLEVDGLSVLQYPASELEDGLARLVLRRHLQIGVQSISLLGQHAAAVHWTDAGPVVGHDWSGLRVTAAFRLAQEHAAWFWQVRITNTTQQPMTVDVLHTQDVALAPWGALRTNEYYVSQYLDLTPVDVPGHGPALAVRQNMPGDRAPWALVGSLGLAAAWATDALQLRRREGLATDLPSQRLQHEHTLAALQSAPMTVEPGQSVTTGFYGVFVGDHPAASAPADAEYAVPALRDQAALPLEEADGPEPVAGQPISLFASAPVLDGHDLSDHDLAQLVGSDPATWADVERDDSALLSGFPSRTEHVVTAAKERQVLRPHGHVLRSGGAFTADERALTATVWMDGGFLSQLTQGHVALGSVLSLRRSYLGLFHAHGLCLFVADERTPDEWRRLGRPSAWAVGPGAGRWWYADGSSLLEVSTTAATDAHTVRVEVRVLAGGPVRVRAALHVSLGADDGAAPEPPLVEVDEIGATLRPPPGSDRERLYPGGTVRLGWAHGSVSAVTGDEALFTDGVSRDLPWVVLTTGAVPTWSLTVQPHLVPDRPGDDTPDGPVGAPDHWADVARRIRLLRNETADTEIGRIDAVLPWFAHDALIHYLSPRGLEQYTGGAWGTRDVSQGPVGLLLALGEHDALRDVLRRIFRAQNDRGEWPQAFDFLARHRSWQQSDAHGDVVYWPLLALGDYLSATGDASLLTEAEPFVGDGGPTGAAPLVDHVARALDAIEAARIPGTRLPAYGHGDWNDSLQPADPSLAAALCSTWTVTLQAQALGSLADGLDAVGTGADPAGRARRIADAGVAAMRESLVGDGILAGYGRVEDGTVVELLVHPQDRRTGLSYSLLPMVHAIAAELLTPQEARTHLTTIREHLTGPDGARLFDRPAAYHGGPMEVFQRAEASTFFGREIGIMYTHAHLRYAEALAVAGEPDVLLEVLSLANPVGMPDRVGPARRRQSTTYYSSSDAAFPDRATAARDYPQVAAGSVALEGGWRVYSSGPGLFLRLVVERLLGIRRRGDWVEIDPVLPSSLNGLTATVPLLGRPVHVAYRVGPVGKGTRAVRCGGDMLEARRLENRYRQGGLAVRTDDLQRRLDAGVTRLDVEVP